MLPAAHRLRDGDGFRAVTRRGERATSRTLAAHLCLPGNAAVSRDAGPVIGFVVGRRVGGAVVRNRVKRRLRHLMRERLERLPVGSALVVRARPSAADASGPDLATDLDRALSRLGVGRS